MRFSRRLAVAHPILILLALWSSFCGPEKVERTTGGGEAVDLLISARVVITMDPQLEVYQPGFVAVRDGLITAVGAAADAGRYRAARTLDRPNHMVLPGLINGHQHAAMVLLRGIADDLELMDWLERYIFPAEAQTVDTGFVYWGTRLAVVEMLQSGTTTFADMYYFLDEVAKASSELGMRSVAGQTVIGFPAPDHPTPAETLEFSRGFIQRWKGHPLVVPAVAPHAPYTLKQEDLLQSLKVAEEFDVPLLIHLAETQEEVRQIQEQHGLRPVGYLQEIGFLSDRVVAAHGVWLTPDEIQILKAAGVGVIHNPESNMKLASGVAPVVEMLEAGIDLGLGTDGAASNNNLDMFEAMDFMAKLHKLARHNPTVVTARQTMQAATLGSARALDMDDQIGSLEAGKKADLVLLSLEGANAQPLYDPYSLAVYSLKGANVESVMIDGKFVMENRIIPGLDVEQLTGRVQQYREKVLNSIQK